MTGFKDWFRDTTMPAEVDDYEQLFIDCWHAATTEATNASLKTIRELATELGRLHGEYAQLRLDRQLQEKT